MKTVKTYCFFPLCFIALSTTSFAIDEYPIDSAFLELLQQELSSSQEPKTEVNEKGKPITKSELRIKLDEEYLLNSGEDIRTELNDNLEPITKSELRKKLDIEKIISDPCFDTKMINLMQKQSGVTNPAWTRSCIPLDLRLYWELEDKRIFHKDPARDIRIKFRSVEDHPAALITNHYKLPRMKESYEIRAGHVLHEYADILGYKTPISTPNINTVNASTLMWRSNPNIFVSGDISRRLNIQNVSLLSRDADAESSFHYQSDINTLFIEPVTLRFNQEECVTPKWDHCDDPMWGSSLVVFCNEDTSPNVVLSYCPIVSLPTERDIRKLLEGGFHIDKTYPINQSSGYIVDGRGDYSQTREGKVTIKIQRSDIDFLDNANPSQEEKIPLPSNRQ